MMMIDWVSRLLPWYPGRPLGFGGKQPRRLMRDWVGMALTGSYRHLAIGQRCEQSMRHLQLPVLAINIEGDELAPRSATDFLLARAAAGQHPARECRRRSTGRRQDRRPGRHHGRQTPHGLSRAAPVRCSHDWPMGRWVETLK
ncbi:hypothetical protein OOZ63_24160 [Paucibacter sp. PLA-PC-4]|nr:hypothetical protein [Paucibacter sp. PLA-PC-4]